MPEIILAKKAGFCFGVNRAVEEAIKVQGEKKKRIFTLGPLIHNKDVLLSLEDRDICSIDMNNLDKLHKGDTVIIRSHGIGKENLELLNKKQLDIIDNTCPFVKVIHNKVEKYYNKGYKIIIIGDANHPEVIGINGWCDNSAIIINKEDRPDNLPKKVCVVCQTTEKQENFQRAIAIIAESCKEFLVFNTICAATEERQGSAMELSKTVDIMLVIGDKTSSNTNKLYEICKKQCINTYLLENHKGLDLVFEENKDLSNSKIGITAGASTPEWVIDKVISKLKGDKHDGK